MFSFQCLSLNGSKLEEARVEKIYSLSFHLLICTCPVKHNHFQVRKNYIGLFKFLEEKDEVHSPAKIWKRYRVKEILRIALERWYCWHVSS